MINREEILAAEQEVKLLNNQRDEELETSRKQLQHAVESLKSAKHEIESSIRKRETTGHTEREKINQTFDERMEPPYIILREKEFLLECKHIHMRKFSDKSGVSNRYGDMKKIHEPVATIYVDDHCRIEAYITKNDRPKNCFSVTVVGNSRLMALMDTKPYSYGCSFNTENANIQTEVHFTPTETEAIGWIAKNKDKILKDFITEHKEIVPRYEQAVKDTDNPEWERLSLEGEKYYYEHNYFRGTETPEYAEVIEKLQAMKTKEEIELENKPVRKKYYFPLKLVGYGTDKEEAWFDAVDGLSYDPGIMDEAEEADEDNEE